MTELDKKPKRARTPGQLAFDTAGRRIGWANAIEREAVRLEREAAALREVVEILRRPVEL